MAVLELADTLNAAVALVDAHVDRGRGSQPAILCGERSLSYGELCELVNRTGNALKELGVRIEERVAILLPDSIEWTATFFATMKIGAVAVPLNTLLKPKDYEYLLNDCRARVLVVHAALLPAVMEIRGNLRFLEHVVVAGDDSHAPLRFEDLTRRAAPGLEPAATSKDDAAFWLYSSGTTGFPKGAVHLHHDMLVAADLYARRTIGLQESDLSLSVAKLFFAYGLGNGLYFPLFTGGATVLVPQRPTPENIFAAVDRYQPTVFYGVPTSYAAMLHAAEKSGRRSLGRVRMCVSAGEPLPKHIFDKWLERFGVQILDGIGSTEILHIFISNRPGRARAGSTGQLVEGFEAKICDDLGNELPARQTGTLFIKGDSIASGYWNKHEESKKTFCGQWINTHDKFLRDEDGYFWYAGRTDDMIKVSGQAVWPSDVESLLVEHPAVLEAGVVGTADPDGLVKPVAYVVLKDAPRASEELSRELQEFVKSRSAPHKYPRAVIFVDTLPKTATGKIQRYMLRDRAAVETPLHAADGHAAGGP